MEHDDILRLLYSGFKTQQLHDLKKRFGTLSYVQKKYQTLLPKEPKFQERLVHAATLSIEEIHEDLKKRKMTVIFYDDPLYPELLKEIYDYPLALFCTGDTKVLMQKRKLAIVGGRERTNYTTDVLKRFIPEVVQAEITVVSGLAKGADSDAHVLTLLNHGQTIGVLGFGHAFHYPSDTQLVRQHIEMSGCVISEYPPNVSPRSWQFPERNRIISGLCQGVMITEAKAKSGSLITCDQALDQNRNVYCLPGPITSLYSEGCNQRIMEGAKIVLKAEHILEDYVHI